MIRDLYGTFNSPTFALKAEKEHSSIKSTTVDYPEEHRKWLALAKKGVPNAQFKVGLAYQLGRDVPKDYKKAAKWHLKAAENGQPEAQYFLGELYLGGLGVKQNSKKLGSGFLGLLIKGLPHPNPASLL